MSRYAIGAYSFTDKDSCYSSFKKMANPQEESEKKISWVSQLGTGSWVTRLNAEFVWDVPLGLSCCIS
jgi:hypothetical protein